VSPNNLKTWLYRYKIEGKTDKLSLGHYPNMSLANAKKRFIELSELRRSGQNPKVQIQQLNEKKDDTLKKLVYSWYENYAVKIANSHAP
jgi:hypothetical protein